MARYEVTDHQTLDDYLRKFRSQSSKKVTVLFFASEKITNKSICFDKKEKTTWCSDCNDALPVIENVLSDYLSKNLDAHHIKVIIDRDTWKNPNNYYRTNYKINSIPTLYNDFTKAKISESECLDEQTIRKIIEG